VVETVSGGLGGTPEDRARQKIDKFLEASGWAVLDRQYFDPRTSRGIAVREHSLVTGSADYLLFVDRAVVGVLEAKLEGTTLSVVSEQTQKYLEGIPESLLQGRAAPFAYESTGTMPFTKTVNQRFNIYQPYYRRGGLRLYPLPKGWAFMGSAGFSGMSLTRSWMN